MPLGADVVDVAQHAALDLVHGLGVEDVVVPLVAGGQVQLRSPAATRAISLHSWTLWPMSFSVSTCRPAFMAAMAAGACRCKRQGDDHRLEAVLLGVVEQFLVGARRP